MRDTGRLPGASARVVARRVVSACRGTLSLALDWALGLLRAVAFWTAVLLPLAYLPLLLVDGSGPVDRVVVGKLVAVNVVALLVGHFHDGTVRQFDRE